MDTNIESNDIIIESTDDITNIIGSNEPCVILEFLNEFACVDITMKKRLRNSKGKLSKEFSECFYKYIEVIDEEPSYDNIPYIVIRINSHYYMLNGDVYYDWQAWEQVYIRNVSLSYSWSAVQ